MIKEAPLCDFISWRGASLVIVKFSLVYCPPVFSALGELSAAGGAEDSVGGCDSAGEPELLPAVLELELLLLLLLLVTELSCGLV